MIKRIKLQKTPHGWLATFLDDPEVIRLFGTDTLPTGFPARAEWDTVRARVSHLNPGSIVSQWGQP